MAKARIKQCVSILIKGMRCKEPFFLHIAEYCNRRTDKLEMFKNVINIRQNEKKVHIKSLRKTISSSSKS